MIGGDITDFEDKVVFGLGNGRRVTDWTAPLTNNRAKLERKYKETIGKDPPEPQPVTTVDLPPEAVKLDMADWWTPTGERYLGRVKKEEILRVIGEGTSETNFEDLRKLKKGELVAAAERRLAGSRWLPEILKS